MTSDSEAGLVLLLAVLLTGLHTAAHTSGHLDVVVRAGDLLLLVELVHVLVVVLLLQLLDEDGLLVHIAWVLLLCVALELLEGLLVEGVLYRPSLSLLSHFLSIPSLGSHLLLSSLGRHLLLLCL